MSIGKNIKELRNERGWSQKELADMLKISRSTLASYEIDRREPSISMAIEIAKVFNVTTDYLFGLED